MLLVYDCIQEIYEKMKISKLKQKSNLWETTITEVFFSGVSLGIATEVALGISLGVPQSFLLEGHTGFLVWISPRIYQGVPKKTEIPTDALPGTHIGNPLHILI